MRSAERDGVEMFGGNSSTRVVNERDEEKKRT